MTTALFGRLAGIAGAVLSSTSLFVSPAVPPQTPINAPQYVDPPTVEQILESIDNPRLKAILKDLSPCESRDAHHPMGNPQAINPNDLDGTPSYGLLQFKPSTLYYEGKRYGILKDIERNEVMNIIFDPEIQVAVASKMIEDRGHQRSFWLQQFPGCAKQYRFWEYKNE